MNGTLFYVHFSHNEKSVIALALLPSFSRVVVSSTATATTYLLIAKLLLIAMTPSPLLSIPIALLTLPLLVQVTSYCHTMAQPAEASLLL